MNIEIKITGSASPQDVAARLEQLASHILRLTDEEIETGGISVSSDLRMEYGEEIDLFERYELQPVEVQAILAKYELEDMTYEACERLTAELKEVGYTMDYYLDAQPYGLKKI